MSVAYVKVKGKAECRKITKVQGSKASSQHKNYSTPVSGQCEFSGSTPNIRPLCEDEARIAEDARGAALAIVRDALRKRMYGKPVHLNYSCAKMEDPYKFCAIPTKEFLKEVIEKLEKVTFQSDSSDDAFAYVFPDDESCTVYLGSSFWEAPPTLKEDSQPGTLIHEVSHFLGTDDITYELLCIKGDLIHGIFVGRRVIVEEDEGRDYDEKSLMTINANSVEYEFETIINHEEEWDAATGKYSCCGETEKNSVCSNRATGHYHLHELVAT